MLKPSTLSVDLTNRLIAQSWPVSVRDNVAVTLTGTGASVNSNMRLVLVRKGTICATCVTFTGAANAFSGTLDLNTEEMVDVFEDARTYGHRKFDLYIYDASGTGFLVKDAVTVENSELRDDDDYPGNVSPISATTTVWGNMRLHNGVLYIYSAGDGLWYPFGADGSGQGVHLEVDGGGGYSP